MTAPDTRLSDVPNRAAAHSGRGREWATVAGVFAVILTIAVVWLAIDRHPPEWDHANHLEHAVLCWRDLTAGNLRDVFGHSSFYPPLVPCLGGLVFGLLPSDVIFGEVVMLAFLAIGMAATYVLGRRFGGGAGGVVAATLYGTAPFVVNQVVRFQLDVPLASMVALSLVALLATDRFEHRFRALLTGLVLGLGMLTKPPLLVCVGPALLLVLARTRGGAAWRNAGLCVALATLVALPWYGPRLLGLSAQIQNRSFKQAAEAGFPTPLSPASLAFYPLGFPRQFGLIAIVLLIVGLWAVIRRRQWFVLAGLAPLIIFLLLQNKQLRYTLPLVPMAAVTAGVGFSALPRPGRVAAGVAIALAAAFQFSSTLFAEPFVPRIVGLPLIDEAPPRRENWQQRRILDFISRDGGGAARTVSVIPNHPYFSAANFRYYATRDDLNLRIGRAWDGEPVGVDYMLLKTGDVGPSWTIDKARRVMERLETDADMAGVFPLIGEFELPDGSKALVRARRITPDSSATPAGLARAVETSLRARLDEVARDVEGLEIRLVHDASILGGRITRLVISATAATVGDLRRRQPALLRLRDLRFVVEDVVFVPGSVLHVGRFDPLDAGRLIIERVTIESDDLTAFLGQAKGFGQTSLILGEGFADLRVGLAGPDVSARVRPVAATDRALALLAERVRVGGIPIPAPFVNWVMRSFDPLRGIAARLPFPVGLGRVRITPGAIRVGGSTARDDGTRVSSEERP